MITLFILGYCIGLFGAVIALARKYCEVVNKLHDLEEDIELAKDFNWRIFRMYVDLRKELLEKEDDVLRRNSTVT